MTFKYELGQAVRDKITSYSGTVTGRVEYLSGEPQYLVADMDETGRPIEEWVSEGRLESVL